MNWPAVAPYLRYNLLVGHFLEDEHWPVERLLGSGLSRAATEEQARAAWAGAGGQAGG